MEESEASPRQGRTRPRFNMQAGSGMIQFDPALPSRRGLARIPAGVVAPVAPGWRISRRPIHAPSGFAPTGGNVPRSPPRAHHRSSIPSGHLLANWPPVQYLRSFTSSSVPDPISVHQVGRAKKSAAPINFCHTCSLLFHVPGSGGNPSSLRN